MKLPIVDISLPEAEAAATLRECCERHGFFYLSGHGISDEIIDAHFKATEQFFALPSDKKFLKGIDGQGYQTLDLNDCRLKADDADAGGAEKMQTTMERFALCVSEAEAGSPAAELPFHAPNVWPDAGDAPLFRPALLAYRDALLGARDKLLRLMALALDLPADWFADKFADGMGTLTPIHYTPGVSRPGQMFGAGAHTDFGIMTILKTDENPGLQVFYQGKWLEVPVKKECFVVNLGDMFQLWSNGRFKSTLHRVVTTRNVHRYSTPFFVHPSHDTMVECLPTCAAESEAPKNPPIMALDYVLTRYRHAKIKVTKGPKTELYQFYDSPQPHWD
jgi:isopenicillin N synthase-like dioxygenase